MKISVVGLGYVGFPAALAFHDAGFNVSGIDISEEVVTAISEGRSPISDSTENLEIPVLSENWSVSNKFDSVTESNVVIITVPTPIKNYSKPDLSFVFSAFRSVFSRLDNNMGTIVILESTVSPGTTRRVSEKVADEFQLKVGVDCHVCYSPERVSPGDGKTVRNVSRVIGSDDQEIGKIVIGLYSKITSEQCKLVSSIEVAEAAKMVENVQRDIDIAFVNELSSVLPKMGIDVEEVLDAAATKWSFHRHRPGIGVGGHCIPVDPYYYIEASNNSGVPSRLAPVAREINEEMPDISAQAILKLIGDDTKGKRVMILGYSYKPNIGDIRMTPVLKLAEKLNESGMKIIVWDPHVSSESIPSWIQVVEDPLEESGMEIIVLATAHEECINLDWKRLLLNTPTRKIFDGRRAMNSSEMETLGWEYSGVGAP
jgi:UDP-N-acetyl-D-galactosamine dehydrogenase